MLACARAQSMSELYKSCCPYWSVRSSLAPRRKPPEVTKEGYKVIGRNNPFELGAADQAAKVLK